MKRILLGMITILATLSLGACSDGADPEFRVKNELAEKVNMQIQTSGGNTININDVEGGQTTAFQSAAEGTIVVTAVIQNVLVSPKMSFFARNDSHSTIVLQAGEVPSFRIDQ